MGGSLLREMWSAAWPDIKSHLTLALLHHISRWTKHLMLSISAYSLLALAKYCEIGSYLKKF
jgi:hypothetical protein